MILTCLIQEKNCSHEVTVVLFSRTFYNAKTLGQCELRQMFGQPGCTAGLQTGDFSFSRLLKVSEVTARAGWCGGDPHCLVVFVFVCKHDTRTFSFNVCVCWST